MMKSLKTMQQHAAAVRAVKSKQLFNFRINYKDGTTKLVQWTSFQRQMAKRRKDYALIENISGLGAVREDQEAIYAQQRAEIRRLSAQLNKSGAQ